MVRFISLAAGVAAAVAVGVAGAERLPRPFPAGCSAVTVAGVPAEVCSSSAARASGDAVVVLHGCGGFGALDYQLASELPAAGIATIYPAFFVASGTPPGGKGFCDARSRGGFENAFAAWRRVVLGAAARLEHTPGVRRVGVVGWSLGGGLALAVAEDPSHPFRALACFSCGAFGPLLQDVNGLPPLLVLSGGTTDAVPLSRAQELVDAARAAGVRAELFVWPHGTHQWYGAQGKAGKRRAIAFLRETLG
jgi:dienelactone hydrolase